MKMLGYLLAIVGIVLIIVALVQHFVGLSSVSHLAIILGVIGIIALVPGALLSMRRSA